jgi:hypothetical protein
MARTPRNPKGKGSVSSAKLVAHANAIKVPAIRKPITTRMALPKMAKPAQSKLTKGPAARLAAFKKALGK